MEVGLTVMDLLEPLGEVLEEVVMGVVVFWCWDLAALASLISSRVLMRISSGAFLGSLLGSAVRQADSVATVV